MSSSRLLLGHPVYPPPSEEMLLKVKTTDGMAEVGNLTFRLDSEFKAGTYIIVCKDVTPGLPPRMKMKHTKILLKTVDLDPPPEEAKIEMAAKGKPTATKKK